MNDNTTPSPVHDPLLQRLKGGDSEEIRRTNLEWIGVHPCCKRVHRGGKLKTLTNSMFRCETYRAG